MGPWCFTLYSAIRRNGLVFKDRIALIAGQQRVTHREVLSAVDSLASGLASAGLRPGDRIGVLAKNCLEFVYLYGAASKLGAIMLPINWRLNPEEIQYIISDGAPSALFVDPEFQETVKSLVKDASFAKLCFTTGKAQGSFRAFGDALRENGADQYPYVKGDDGFVIIHTAAVQGRPRGALLTHQGPLLAAMQMVYRWGLTPTDVNISMLPLFHIAAINLVLCALLSGGVNIIMSGFDLNAAFEHMRKDNVTFFGTFPPMLKSLLDKAEETGQSLSGIRHVVGLEQADTVKRFEELSGGTFWTVYGQSETSGFLTMGKYFERTGSTGTPLQLAEVEICDQDGNTLRPGTSGEIVARGPLVFRGYWNLEKETEYTFRGGWHHTGDRGRLDEDGYLWFEGRLPEKELIKPGGENVYPAEVEKVILEHEAVKEVVVIGVPDPEWGEAIKAVCVLEGGKSLSETDLIAFVAARIARYKKPKHVRFVSQFPKSADGSIDRQKVRADHGTT